MDMQDCENKRLAAFGVLQRREQKIDGGTGGVNRAIQITSEPLHPNIRLVNAPGLVGRFEMIPHASLQLSGRIVEPNARRCVIGATKPRSSRSSSIVSQR